MFEPIVPNSIAGGNVLLGFTTIELKLASRGYDPPPPPLLEAQRDLVGFAKTVFPRRDICL
jgi:hypothetical protein